MANFIRERFAQLLRRRHGGVIVFLLLFVGVATTTRLALIAHSGPAISWDFSLLAALAWGLVFDLGTGLLWALPLTLILTMLPAGFFRRSWVRGLSYVALFAVFYLLLFGAVAEWMFWDEFNVRFNFIAVDYLVYTTEVIANIRESYPMPAIFVGIGLVAAGGTALWLRTGLLQRWLAGADEGWRRRYTAAAGWLVATLVMGVALDSQRLPAFANNYNREAAKNGLWSLVAAFRNNQLDYDQFYSTLPIDDAFRMVHDEFTMHGAAPKSPMARDTLRFAPAPRTGPELRPNVIQITVESLSADFVTGFNHASRLTPNLGALAQKSLVFEKFYATGTRTDRGIEALTLALPPTPGRSLVKRPRNENLFTLGSVFRSRGYDTAFIYGGYGYFDNMNYFFRHNGYRVIDRSAVTAEDITFANAWGACDEDVFRWTIREADTAHAAGKPFHFFVMTTSNHRPYTYPDG
ncbi:MAG TPA: sulfatase-like hydrolase/transferase, partial [Opitutus sp.]|nr:sulfatase-like hydrolase/transferase [Opitutus sp.]